MSKTSEIFMALSAILLFVFFKNTNILGNKLSFLYKYFEICLIFKIFSNNSNNFSIYSGRANANKSTQSINILEQ